MQKNQKTYSVAEAARAKGRTVTAIYQALRGGRIPGAKKMYDRWFIPASYVESRAKRLLRLRVRRAPKREQSGVAATT